MFVSNMAGTIRANNIPAETPTNGIRVSKLGRRDAMATVRAVFFELNCSTYLIIRIILSSKCNEQLSGLYSCSQSFWQTRKARGIQPPGIIEQGSR